MHHPFAWDVLLAVAVAAFAGWGLTGLARRVAPRCGLLDRPDNGRKSHSGPMPLLGGLAVYGALATALILAWVTRQPWLIGNPQLRDCSRMLLLSGGLFCLIGLWDDVRELRPRTKFLLQVFASLPFVLWCRSVESIQLLGSEVVLGPFGALFTIFWLVGCANVMNLVDGLDGLAGTIGLIVCVAVALQAGIQHIAGVAPLALIAGGALFGFLLHNWPPAKIFLGDSGSLLIGFLVGVLSIESSLKTATGFALAVPLVLVSVPVFDTLMAIIRRKLTGRGIGEADRGHIHHCLQNRGLTRFQSLMVLSGLCLAMAAAALASVYFQNDWLALGICAGLLLLLVVGRVFGYDETLLFFRYWRVVSSFLGDSSAVLRTRLLVAQWMHAEGADPIAFWQRVIEQTEQCGGTRLEFCCRGQQRDDDQVRLTWTSPQPGKKGSDPFTEGVGPLFSPNGAEWEIHYAVARPPGRRVALHAWGDSGQSAPNGALLRTFDEFCRRWPLEFHADGTELTGPLVPVGSSAEARPVLAAPETAAPREPLIRRAA